MSNTERPQTYPCADCGTTGGHIVEGENLPMRTRSLCKVCYTHHHRAGTLDRYPPVPQFITRRGLRTRFPTERRRGTRARRPPGGGRRAPRPASPPQSKPPRRG
jgi:hypothetical protein